MGTRGAPPERMRSELMSVLVCLPFLLVALFSRRVGRWVLGVAYLATATFNLLVTSRDPGFLAWGAEHTFIPAYRALLESLVLPNALVFVLLVGVLWEAATGLMILSRGKAAKAGLLMAIAFNVLISPLDLGILYGNLVLIAAEVRLLRGTYETSAWDLLRPSRRHAHGH